MEPWTFKVNFSGFIAPIGETSIAAIKPAIKPLKLGIPF